MVAAKGAPKTLIMFNKNKVAERKIRVLYISHIDYLGGGETFLETLLNNNLEVEPRVFLNSKQFSHRLKRKGIGVYYSKSFGKVYMQRRWWQFRFIKIFIFSFREITRLVKLNAIDIVHANSIKAAVYGIFPALFCRRPFLWTCNDVYLGLNNRIGRIINLFSRNTVVVSQGSKGIYKGKGATLIPYGIDLNRFNPQTVAPGFIRDKYHIPSHKIIIGMVGVLKRIKGFHIALEAVDILKDNGLRHRFTCLFVGEGIDEEREYGRWLREEIKKRGLHNDIIMRGFVEDIEKVYRDIDILVNSSIIPEAFPVSALEAMAMKKIVVASRLGGLREVIDDGEDGFLFSAGDAQCLAQRLKRLIESPGSFEGIGERAYIKVISKFSAEKMVSRYNYLYRNSLSKS